MILRLLRPLLLTAGSITCTAGALFAQTLPQNSTTARLWNEELLQAIRRDFARPTVHARNLYHVSAALYDAYHIVGGDGETVLMGKTVGGYQLLLDRFPVPAAADLPAARNTAMSYAAYRLLRYRFGQSPGRRETWDQLDSVMVRLGYSTRYTSTNYSNGDAAALGNAIAFQIIAYGNNDGSNDANGYAPEYYQPINPPLTVNAFGNPNVVDVDRWQPLRLTTFIDQSGNQIPGSEQEFVGAEWGNVVPFALDADDLTVYQRDGHDWHVYHDPGPPPLIKDPTTQELMMRSNEMVIKWTALLDPADDVLIDISPGATGEYADPLPTREEYFDFYDEYNGGDATGGLALNPVTGEPYAPNIVRRGDYFRILAEFWADGPASETPPGHWFTIMNYGFDHPAYRYQWRGQGPVLDREAYQLQAYVTLGGALHDAAVATWGIKGYYDSGRPISVIRYMAEKGQRSDPNLPNYHPHGLRLEAGVAEFITSISDPLAGSQGEHIGEIKVWSWLGHEAIADPEVDNAGVGWIRAKEWVPFQRRTFVSPPFAGYVSGHSTFSRTAAEVLTSITGSEYFPGGLGTFGARKGNFIPYEYGPTDSLTLTWATYRGASDEVSLSRIYGGIHPPYDDIPGRRIGIKVAKDALAKANSLFDSQAPTLVAAIASEANLNTVSASVNDTLSLRLTFSEAIDTSTFSWSWPADFNSGAVVVEEQRWISATEYLIRIKSTAQGHHYDDVYLNISGQDLYNNALRQNRTQPLFNLRIFLGVNLLGNEIEAVLYPNPASSSFNIRTSAPVEQVQVELRDLAGRKLRQWQRVTLMGESYDITDLPAGAYVVSVTTPTGSRTTWRLLKVGQLK